MNRFDLNTEELINLLLDKETSADDKTIILQELQKHPESIEMLNQYSSLQDLLSKTKVTPIPPPSDWTNSIMQQVKLLSDRHFAFLWFGKLKYALFGLLLLLPFGLYFSLEQSSDFSSKNYKADQQKTETVPNTNNSHSDFLSLNNNNQNLETNSSKSASNKSPLANKEKVRVINQTPQQLRTNLVDNNLRIGNNLHNTFDIKNNSDNFRLNSKDIHFSNSSNQSTHTIIINVNTPNKITYSQPYPDKTNFLIQTRGIYAITKPEKNFPENDFIGNTYNFGIYLDIYENVYAGAEFGTEVFSQIFFGNNQQTTIYDQTPTLFYFGLAGKYEFNQLSFGKFKPVGHLFVGGSSLGPLIRLNTVLQADLSRTIGVFAGIEAGALYYKNQNIWYNSSKLGIVGGINFKF